MELGEWGSWLAATAGLAASTLGAWLLAEAVRFLRTRISVERQQELYAAAQWVVSYVEQEWRSGRITKELRLDTALELLRERLPWVTPDLARQVIEAAVLGLKTSLDKAGLGK